MNDQLFNCIAAPDKGDLPEARVKTVIAAFSNALSNPAPALAEVETDIELI